MSTLLPGTSVSKSTEIVYSSINPVQVVRVLYPSAVFFRTTGWLTQKFGSAGLAREVEYSADSRENRLKYGWHLYYLFHLHFKQEIKI